MSEALRVEPAARTEDPAESPVDPLLRLLRQRHLPALDGLRAVAVGMVIVFHAGQHQLLPEWPWLRYVDGGLGVTLFFVLSGFLITHLLIREHDDTGRVSLRNFYVRRTLRIWPAYFAFLALVMLAHPVWPAHRITGAHVISAAAFYHNYFILQDWPARGSYLSHLWSLAVEEQFYLLWPACFIWLARQRRRDACIAVGALIGLVFAWRSVAYLALGFGWGYANFALEARLDSLAIGGLLALASLSPAFQARTRWLAGGAWAPLVPIAAILWLESIEGKLAYTVFLTAAPLLMAVLILQLLRLAGRPAWAWLDHPILAYLGRISYPLYLYHLVGEMVARGLQMGARGRFPVAVAAAILIASASYYLIERPFLRLKERFQTPRTRSAPRVAV
jgi:peptidoglycan/LPS O-acetylase OafA/YrhL